MARSYAPCEGGATGHATQGEDLAGLLAAIEHRAGLIPGGLPFLAKGVLLGHEGLAAQQAQRLLALAYVLANAGRGDRDARVLVLDTAPDPVRGVALLARGALVGGQDGVDERHGRSQLGPGARPGRALLGNGAAQRLPHQAAVHPEVAGHPGDGADAELIFTTDLLEELHAGCPPAHPTAPPANPTGSAA